MSSYDENDHELLTDESDADWEMDEPSESIEEEASASVQLAVGDIDDITNDEEDLDIPTNRNETREKLPLPRELTRLLLSRMKLLIHLQELDSHRKVLLESATLSETVKNEYRRQQRELQKLPSSEKAQELRNNLKERLSKIMERVRSGEVEPIPPEMAQAYEMAFEQWRTLRQRGKYDEAIINNALPLVKDEPLLRFMRNQGINADQLFGWSVYRLALEALQEKQLQGQRTAQRHLDELQESSKGFLSRLKSRISTDKDESEEAEEIEHAGQARTALLTAIGREIRDIDPMMVQEFWNRYEDAAQLLIEDKASESEKIHLRAFLRYGLLGTAEWFLNPDVRNHLLHECSNSVERSWNTSMGAQHVLYADEYIWAVVRGYITPSIDEDLELNQRNSPEWKADRARRRKIFCHQRIPVLEELHQDLDEKVIALRVQQEELEEKKGKLLRSAPDYRKQMNDLGQKIQHARVEAGRYTRAMERISGRYLPQQKEIMQDSQAKIEETGVRFSELSLARQEARAVHRVTRLCAKLKDPFLPFALRDNYKLQSESVNDRPAILNEVARIEHADTTIFMQSLIPVKKAAQRINQRFAPIILMAPGCGFMGYSWNPRGGSEIGRLVLPVYSPRQGIRERLLAYLFADFRWDTSKASAGVDLLTSDTIVAAYATVRWEYRRKQRQVREKAAIYSEESDRQNWRRHYELFIQSANESGKRLFYKCPEVYDVILRYIGLPEGAERMRR